MSWVAWLERLASALTSAATTAKPRPASPARAASIVAFSARRLVWVAICSITAVMVPISRELRLWASMTVSMSSMAA
ncbi:hypothetical protein D3C72_2397970 [compost metagenome]